MIGKQLTSQDFEIIMKVAPVMHGSRLFGVASPEAAAAIMIKGLEVGFGLAAAFEFIQVVEGRPTLSPKGALALIQNSDLLTGLRIEDKPNACTVWMRRANGVEHTITWTMEDAERTGQVKDKSAWKTYPANMLRWRAVGFCADVVFPDIIGGMKRADEFGAEVDKAGEIVSLPAPAPVAQLPAPQMDILISKYGAEKILEANGGAIPITPEEIEKVATVLEASNGNVES